MHGSEGIDGNVPAPGVYNLTGATLGKYLLIEKLGQGGMAQVYKAYQAGLDRYVAIKVLHPHLTGDDEFVVRFQREARAIAALEHPNIVRVYDFEVDAGLAYLVMEYLQGASLKTQLRDLGCRNQRMDLAEGARIVGALADALDHAHRRGVVHRDVKPSNVQIAPDGRVVLADFGIARMVEATVITEGSGLLGTPAYMSPEQCRGEAGDGRSDVYALGVLLYQLCTGHVPFDGDTPYAVILKHISAPLPPPRSLNPDLPEPVERIILKALAKHPGDRYQTAAAMGSDVRASVAPTPAEVKPPDDEAGRPTAERRHAFKLKASVAVLAILVCLAVAAVLWVARPWQAPVGLSVASPSRAATETVIVRGPEQVDETWLDPDQPDQPFGKTDLVHLQGPLTPDRVLLRFALPAATLAGRGVVSASLRVRVALWGEQSFPGAAVVYRVLTPWETGTVTYQKPWSAAGMAAGVDYDATPLDLQPVPDAGWVSFDVTPAVRYWREHGGSNHGLVLMMSADSHNQAHHWVYLSAQPNPDDRPALHITVGDEP